MYRPPKAVVALITAGLLYLVVLWAPGRAMNSQMAPQTGFLSVPDLETGLENAHKFSTADAFLPHLQAVVQQTPDVTMAEAKSTCNWLAPKEVNFQYDDKTEWAAQDRSDEELNLRRLSWHKFIEHSLLPYEEYKDRFEDNGRGIIIVAGNQKSMKRVRVLLRALTRLGCELPIELHYWASEMTEESKKEVSTLWPRMYFNDLADNSKQNIVKTNHDQLYINYQLKTAAMVNSRFAEPLMLDSDNIPVIDPETLYESSVYKEFGTLFWPDIARTRPNNPMWSITNTKCRMDEYEQESGQLLIDKRRFFYHMQLAAWFNSDEYYNGFLLGDKDMFRFAWHALKTKYGSPSKWLTSVGTLSPDGYYCGHSFAQHHPDGRVAFLHGGLVKTMPKEVMRWEREKSGGIFQVYKRSEFDERHIVNVNVSIKWDTANLVQSEYLSQSGKEMQSCTDMHDVQPRPLDEIVPLFEHTYEEIGGYWLLDS
ncbi:MAG: hypothetical protein M1820_007582 [Bogoriella megaspora]|nr:MAG: hypothetical protein M1820_007582 [Bogoriella megaspora]